MTEIISKNMFLDFIYTYSKSNHYWTSKINHRDYAGKMHLQRNHGLARIYFERNENVSIDSQVQVTFMPYKYNSEQTRLDLNVLYVSKAAVFAHNLVFHCIAELPSSCLAFVPFTAGLFTPCCGQRGPALLISVPVHSLPLEKTCHTGLLAGDRCLCKERHTYSSCRPSSASTELNKKPNRKWSPSSCGSHYLAFITWTILLHHCFFVNDVLMT